MKLKKLLSTLALSSLIAFNCNIADASETGLLAFRETYLSSPVDNRSFSESIDFFGANFHAEVLSEGFLLRDATLTIGGNIKWEFTDPSTYQTQERDIPFYLSQMNDVMTLYVNRNNRWYKTNLPAFPVQIANAIKSTEINDLRNNLQLVKDAEVFREDEKERNFRVTLDGQKVAQLIPVQATQKSFYNRLINALQSTDLTLHWTVNRDNFTSVSTSVNLTSLLQAYAKSVLNEAAEGKIVLSANDRKFYEAIGYYCELHSNSVYRQMNDNTKTVLPNGIKSAVTNDNVLNDIMNQIAIESKK